MVKTKPKATKSGAVNYASLLAQEHDRLEEGRGSRSGRWKPDPGKYKVQFVGLAVKEWTGKKSKKLEILATPKFLILEVLLSDDPNAATYVDRSFEGDSFSSDLGSEFTADILFSLVETITGEAADNATEALDMLIEQAEKGFVLEVEVKVNKKGYPNVYVLGLTEVDDDDPEEDPEEDDRVLVNASRG
ncbi:MAG: hypothetical protein IIC73_03525 [Armatimonadetes bacterium]|nr:hypothetical protein [Armatimonadota bacterium]